MALMQLPFVQARANDPSRLQNRGGKLLAEQKAQAKLMKQLPKVIRKPLLYILSSSFSSPG